MDKDIYDVAIIGTGPSGLAAAIRCLKNNLTCLSITGRIDDMDLPFQSTPAESIHPGVESLLKMLSAEETMSSCSRGNYTDIYDGTISQELGSDENGKWAGCHMDKPRMLKSLLSIALNYGLNVLANDKIHTILDHGEHIEIKTANGKILKSRFVIDGSGRSQVIGQLLKLEKEYFSAPIICWTGLTKVTDTNVMDNLRTSFFMGGSQSTWLAPEINSCCTWTQISMEKLKTYTPPKILAAYPLISQIQVYNMRWRLYNRLQIGKIFLCGDAAGVLDPSSGQGILMSLMSAIMAADAVASTVHGMAELRNAGNHYNAWFQESYRRKAEQLSNL